MFEKTLVHPVIRWKRLHDNIAIIKSTEKNPRIGLIIKILEVEITIFVSDGLFTQEIFIRLFG